MIFVLPTGVETQGERSQIENDRIKNNWMC